MKEWQGQLSCSYAFRAGSTAPLTTGSALGCCPGGKKSLLSGVLQPVRIRASTPTLVTLMICEVGDPESVC